MAKPQEYQELQTLLQELNRMTEQSRKASETTLRNAKRFLALVETDERQKQKPKDRCKRVEFPVNLHLTKKTGL